MIFKPYYFILFLIFCSSSASAGLLLYYMAPESDIMLGLGLMGASLFLAAASFLSLFLFFLKKIYYRGDVSVSTMNASIRQSILITIGLILMLVLVGLNMDELRLILIVWAAIGCLEVMAQAIE